MWKFKINTAKIEPEILPIIPEDVIKEVEKQRDYIPAEEAPTVDKVETNDLKE